MAYTRSQLLGRSEEFTLGWFLAGVFGDGQVLQDYGDGTWAIFVAGWALPIRVELEAALDILQEHTRDSASLAEAALHRLADGRTW